MSRGFNLWPTITNLSLSLSLCKITSLSVCLCVFECYLWSFTVVLFYSLDCEISQTAPIRIIIMQTRNLSMSDTETLYCQSAKSAKVQKYSFRSFSVQVSQLIGWLVGLSSLVLHFFKTFSTFFCSLGVWAQFELTICQLHSVSKPTFRHSYDINAVQWFPF